jgi:hypothetical protein
MQAADCPIRREYLEFWNEGFSLHYATRIFVGDSPAIELAKVGHWIVTGRIAGKR